MQSRIKLSRTRSVVAESELSGAISSSWERDTSFDPSRWSTDNPAWGQCAVSALIVQDILGGDLLVAKVNGVDHYWNVLSNRREVDFTRQQFGEIKTFQRARPIERTYVLSYPDTDERYQRLRKRVFEKLRPKKSRRATRQTVRAQAI